MKVVTVETITQLFLNTKQFKQVYAGTTILLEPVKELEYGNGVLLYCNNIVLREGIVQKIWIESNPNETGIIISFTCCDIDPYEPVTNTVVLPCLCEDVAVAVFDGDEELVGEVRLTEEAQE